MTPPDKTAQVSPVGVTFTHEDISRVVEDFYTQVEHDKVLSVPFSSVKNWPEHIKRLTHFWWSRFGGESYMDVTYDPVGKHLEAGFNDQFLQHWLHLFHQTLSTCLTPSQCELWKTISQRMGQSLAIRNEMLKKEFESQSR